MMNSTTKIVVVVFLPPFTLSCLVISIYVLLNNYI